MNNVGLQPGSNTLSIVVTTPDNQTSTQTLTINSSGVLPFRFRVSNSTGLGPLTVEFFLTDRTNAAVSEVDISCNLDGSATFTTTTVDTSGIPSDLGGCTYGNPGYNSVSIKVLDGSGQVIYTASQSIFLASVTDRDLILQSVYLGVLGRLQASDIPDALNSLTSGRV